MLLVDDDRLILATLAQSLRSAGFITTEADSGAAALQRYADGPPDLAIVDYDIPDMNGLEITRALQTVSPVPVIFLSAYGDDGVVSAAAEAGAMAYVVKPIDPPKLTPTVYTVLKRFEDYKTLRGESAQLTSALKSTRTTSIVVGLLMARMNLSERQAYDRLRHYCRSRNRKVVEVASEILGTAELFNNTLSEISGAPAASGRPAR